MAEGNLSWHFGEHQPGNEKGPKDVVQLRFQGNGFDSLMRESIQNSMDAVCDRTKPVEFELRQGEINRRDFPNLFKIKDHIQGCIDRYQGNDSDNAEAAEQRFRPMITYLENHEEGPLSRDVRIIYWRFTDKNTTGMRNESGNPTCSFNAFIADGINEKQKSDGRGGSFGFGKNVFWALSKINTVLVSSKYGDEVTFVGQAKLSTHNIQNQEYLPNGLYGWGEGGIVTDANLIPEQFKQTEQGTSVYVLGCEQITPDIEKQLIQAVLRSFWMAIYKNKLKVTVCGVTINKDSLGEVMNSYFPENESYNNNGKSLYDYNPRYYYEVVCSADSNEDSQDCYKYEEKITINGKETPVVLYLRNREGATGSIICMRRPLMVTHVFELDKQQPTEGVFLCNDPDGDDFLRLFEDVAHDEWTNANFRANTKKRSARDLTVIKTFINDKIKDQTKRNAEDVTQVRDLEKILRITTPQGATTGQQDMTVDPDTIRNPQKDGKKSTPRKPVIYDPRPTTGTNDNNGPLRTNTGGNGGGGEGLTRPGDLGGRSRYDPNGRRAIYAVPVAVEYRTWSQNIDNKLWHIIHIGSDEEISNAYIKIFAVNDGGKSSGVAIDEVSKGYQLREGKTEVDSDTDEEKKSIKVQNILRGPIKKGHTYIKIRFNSELKYSLRLETEKEIITNNN